MPDKALFVYGTVLKTPPLGVKARRMAGYLLRKLQQGSRLEPGQFKPMTRSIGPRCYELRFDDEDEKRSWRIIYRIDTTAIVVVHAFEKTTNETPRKVRELCKRRFKEYDDERKEVRKNDRA